MTLCSGLFPRVRGGSAGGGESISCNKKTCIIKETTGLVYIRLTISKGSVVGGEDRGGGIGELQRGGESEEAPRYTIQEKK